jgi:hypothetical protein
LADEKLKAQIMINSASNRNEKKTSLVKMPTFYLLFTLFIVVNFSYGQQYVDLVKIDYDLGLSQAFTDSAKNAQFSELAVDAIVPIVLNKKVAILTGALLEKTDFSVSPTSPDVSVYGLMLKAGVNIKHNDKWSGTYLLLPKLSSDLKKISQKDFQFGGIAFIKYAPKPTFNYRFGFYANSDLFGPMLVPIVGIYLLKNRWEINCSLPINADVSYQLIPNLKLGARFQGINKSYLIHQGKEQYVEKVNNEIGLYSSYAIGKFHFQILAGYALGRSFRVYDTPDRLGLALSAIKFNNNRIPLNPTFSDGFVLKAGLTFRIPTNTPSND